MTTDSAALRQLHASAADWRVSNEHLGSLLRSNAFSLRVVLDERDRLRGQMQYLRDALLDAHGHSAVYIAQAFEDAPKVAARRAALAQSEEARP